MPTKKPAILRAKDLSDAKLEEGDHWYAVSMSWWQDFQACRKPKASPSVRNDTLIDKELSSKVRNVALLKPKLEEGTDFEFVPEASWEVIARELDFDWVIRREVVYQRSDRELQIEAHPFAFKISYWNNDNTEPKELVDEANQVVVILGSRVHTLGQLLSEVWLSAPDNFRRYVPQLVNCIGAASNPSSAIFDQVRVCYRKCRAVDEELEWTPIEKMVKRSRGALSSLRLKPRAKKRQAREEGESSEEEPSDVDGDEQIEDEHSGPGFGAMLGIKLGDLRLDNRSETATGTARLHELLVEQRSQGSGEFGWPSQNAELQWRTSLVRGDLLDANDTMKTWCEARVLAARRNKVHVHYRGWESRFDEWILRVSRRIAPPHSHVAKWRSALREHDVVQVGIQVPRRQHPKWRNATVLEVGPSASNELDEGVQDGFGLRVHVQVDGDDLWLPAHDDMLSQPNTHIVSKRLTKDERQLLAHEECVPSDSTEEQTADTQDDDDQDQENDIEGIGGDTYERINYKDTGSPTMRPSHKLKSTAKSDVRDRVGPARNLSESFSKVQDRGRSSAGRTPARTRSQSRARVSSDDSSPMQAPSSGQVSAVDFQRLWTQVGNDLHSSWEQLGKGLMALLESKASEDS